MKKNILVMLSILIITILSGCQKKEEVSTYEQDRVAQYILDNVELVDGSEINKIKFMQYEKKYFNSDLVCVGGIKFKV